MYYRDCYVWINSDKTVRSESLRAELIVIGFWIICAFCSDRIGMLLVVRSIDLRRREDTSQEGYTQDPVSQAHPPSISHMPRRGMGVFGRRAYSVSFVSYLALGSMYLPACRLCLLYNTL
jgi:hypothetical protein